MRSVTVLAGLVLLLSTACGDDSPDRAPDACGPGPYVSVRGELKSFTSEAAKAAHAELTVDECPGVKFAADEEGRLEGRMTKGMRYNPRVSAESYLTARAGEQILLSDFDASTSMIPSSLSGLFPHLRPDAPVMLVLVTFSESPAPAANPLDPCSTLDGFVVSVKGHPEAVMTYYAGEKIPNPDASLQATSALGLAEVSGLSATKPGELIELSVAKPGCDKPSFASYPHTGRYILEDGVVTLAGAFMPPVPPP